VCVCVCVCVCVRARVRVRVCVRARARLLFWVLNIMCLMSEDDQYNQNMYHVLMGPIKLLWLMATSTSIWIWYDMIWYDIYHNEINFTKLIFFVLQFMWLILLPFLVHFRRGRDSQVLQPRKSGDASNASPSVFANDCWYQRRTSESSCGCCGR